MKEGSMILYTPKNKRSHYEKVYLFAFNDIIIISKAIVGKQGEYQFIETVMLETVSSVEDINGIIK
jgi:hypothetical protein